MCAESLENFLYTFLQQNLKRHPYTVATNLLKKLSQVLSLIFVKNLGTIQSV